MFFSCLLFEVLRLPSPVDKVLKTWRQPDTDPNSHIKIKPMYYDITLKLNSNFMAVVTEVSNQFIKSRTNEGSGTTSSLRVLRRN